MLLKTKGWDTSLLPSIETGLKYRFTQVFQAPPNCISLAAPHSWGSCFSSLGVSSEGMKPRKGANRPLQQEQILPKEGFLPLPEASNSFLVPAITRALQRKNPGTNLLLRPAVSHSSLPAQRDAGVARAKRSYHWPLSGKRRLTQPHEPDLHLMYFKQQRSETKARKQVGGKDTAQVLPKALISCPPSHF